jgi:hypothetical protein
MKLFGRTGGYYLFWTGISYFTISVICAIWLKEIPVHYITMSWLLVLAVPLFVPPVGRYFGMTPFFGEDSMWRKREIGDRVSKDIDNNVVKFPEIRPDLKLVEPPKDMIDVTRPPYTIGINESGNVQFSMKTDYGNTTLTMNDEGVIGLIEDLAHYIRRTHTVTIEGK